MSASFHAQSAAIVVVHVSLDRSLAIFTFLTFFHRSLYFFSSEYDSFRSFFYASLSELSTDARFRATHRAMLSSFSLMSAGFHAL